MFRTFVAVTCLVLLVPGALAVDRVSGTEKGSLLVYPKVELRWDARGVLTQDTFITLNNDYNQDVDIQLYFVSETCTRVDNVFTLTKNQPVYWSAATGLPKGVSPWTVLGDPYPDPEGSGDLIMRGYILLWAVSNDPDTSGWEIRWNHLYGGATIVDYENGTAWEYNAYAFAVVNDAIPNGGVTGSEGILNLNGVEYAFGFEKLLLDFFASGSLAFSGGGRMVSHDTDLTLLIVTNDLRQETTGPRTTKAKFEIWNQNEVGFSGMEYCITKWDENLLSAKGGHFLIQNLQTDKGRARISGLQSAVCDHPPVMSTSESLLGVAAKVLLFDNTYLALSGTNLFGSGTKAATIWYDIPEAPPEKIISNDLPAAGPKVVW